MAKAHITLKETYRKGVTIPIESVLNLLNDPREGCVVEMKARGTMSDGSEFMVIEIRTNPVSK